MGRGLESEASHLYKFVLDKLKCCFHIRFLSALFCFVYGISRSLGKRPRIRGDSTRPSQSPLPL